MNRHTYHRDGTLPKGDEIFVFGSNLAGRHGKGAALVAKKKFYAKQFVCYGRTGYAFALPTKNHQLETLSLREIHKWVRQFRDYAKEHKELTFFVTRVGCGLAGYKDSQIAPMFRGATRRCNMPLEWKEYLE